MKAYFKLNNKLGIFDATEPGPEDDPVFWINSIIDQVKEQLPKTHKGAVLVTTTPFTTPQEDIAA
jgi:hypothetical protein